MFDVCLNRKIDPQTEADTDFIVQELKAGNVNSRKMYVDYMDFIKKRDNDPASDRSFLTDNATILSALHCKDPQDVVITTPPADIAPGKMLEVYIDFWKPESHQVFDYVKAQKSLTPDVIKAVNDNFAQNIPKDDRRLVVTDFNQRAQAEHLPFEVVLDRKGNLKLQAKGGKMEASK